MKLTDLIENLAMGAFVGCFVLCMVQLLLAITEPDLVFFTSQMTIHSVPAVIIIGWSFSLTSFIYEREEISFPFQVLFQRGIGMTVLFITAIYLGWIPLSFGWQPIVIWILIACIFAAIFWSGFMIYYYLLSRQLNDKISKLNN